MSPVLMLLAGKLRQLSICTHGIAIVELALFLPVIITILFGSIAAYDAFRANRQVMLAANTVADLISRRTSLDDDARDALFQTAEALLGSFTNGETFGIAISSIVNDSGNLKVLWSEAGKKGQSIKNKDLDTIDLPTISEDESIILVRVSTEYVPILISSVFDKTEFSNAKILRPRFVAKVQYL